MSEKLRCGIIGFEYGHQGAFAGALARMADVEVVGVADLPDASGVARTRENEFAGACGVEYLADYARLLDSGGIDFVSLCVRPERNPDIVEEMCARLDELSPETAPHKHYVAFRYGEPSSESALKQMAADGVTRAVAFTQYAQFSCATTGSSLNELWRAARRVGLQEAFEWSVIDRWFAHPRFVEAMTETVRAGLDGLRGCRHNRPFPRRL